MVHDSKRQRKILHLSLSFCVLVHFCNILDVLAHLFHNCGGADDPNAFAKAANPAKELWADFNLDRHGEMMIVYWNKKATRTRNEFV